MQRRNFIFVFSAIGFIYSWPGFGWHRTAQRSEPASAVTLWRGCFEDPESIVIIGKRYLALFPQDTDRAALLKLITSRETCVGGKLNEKFFNQCAQRFAQDFESGRMVEIEGWLLSVTEARLCALISIS